jgi:hypothetical protein
VLANLVKQMLALFTWCSCKLASTHLAKLGKVEVQALSKLSNKHVGSLWLSPPTPSKLVATIKDLQAQASLLLQHVKRTPNYMVLVLDDFKLPSLTYRNDMTKDQEEQALRCLQQATTESTFQLLWDDDDSRTFDALRRTHGLSINNGEAWFSARRSIPPEICVLTCYAHQITRLKVSGSIVHPCLDLNSLYTLDRVTSLHLSFGTITSWDFVKQFDLRQLEVTWCKVQTTNSVDSHTLESLELFGACVSPTMLTKCTNLQQVTLCGERDSTLLDKFWNECKTALPHVRLAVRSPWI